jgi:hypothetical protein
LLFTENKVLFLFYFRPNHFIWQKYLILLIIVGKTLPLRLI